MNTWVLATLQVIYNRDGYASYLLPSEVFNDADRCVCVVKVCYRLIAQHSYDCLY